MTRILFTVLVAGLAVQRLVELRWSRRNEQEILKRGGREHAPVQFEWMKVLHTTWFVSMLVEVFALKRKFPPLLASVAVLTLAVGQSLRYAAIRTLGWRWSVRVMTLPHLPPVSDGIYRHIRHPNYLGVALEILAVPLIHGAYLTALIFSLANGLLLRARIQQEEQAMNEANHYEMYFRERPRWFPRLFRSE